MIKAECDNCGKDKADDYIYCRECYERLKQELNDANDVISDYENQIRDLNSRVDDLELELTKERKDGLDA